jgi:hypothetical protein
MLETPHVALGLAIAVAIPNPLISIPLAFASHFALDMVPHWNPHINTEMKKYGKLTNPTLFIIAVDLALALILTSFVAFRALPDSSLFLTILLSSFVSILPDIAEGPYFLFGWRNKYLDVILRFQRSIQANANIFWGTTTQIITIIASLYWIFVK